MSTIFDVLVVGAGPAGSATATVLARSGHRVLLLDRARFPRDKPCGDYCNPGAAQSLRELGCYEAVLATGAAPISSMRVLAHDRTGFEAPFPSGAGLLVPRRRLDACLLAHAGAQGAEILEGVQITQLHFGAGYVEACAESGRTRAVRARLLIAADGMHSTIVQRLGRRQPTADGLFTVGAYFSGVRGERPQGELHLGRNLYAGIAHFGGGAANVCLALSRSSFRHQTPEQAFEQGLRSLPTVSDALASARRDSAYRCSGPVGFITRDVIADRVLAVGDAAGQVDPMTGQGIALALRSGILAAETATRALARGDLSRSALRSDVRQRARELAERRRVARWVHHLVFRPSLTPFLIKRLGAHPTLASQLLGATGDVVPTNRLRIVQFLLRLSVGLDAHSA